MDRRTFSGAITNVFVAGSVLGSRAFAAAKPLPPTSLTVDGAPAPVAVPATGTRVNAGSITVAPSSSADITLDVGFRASVVIFYSVATFYQRQMTYSSSLAGLGGQTTNGSARGICMGAYDGSNQWSQMHAVTFADGRRDGYLTTDAVYDAAETIGGSFDGVGARIVGRLIDNTSVVLKIERPSAASDGMLTMHWVAIGGCNARVGTLPVPHGGYHADAPRGVTVRGLSFQPKGLIFAPWRQTNNSSTFFTATAGSAIGFASGPMAAQQGAIGSSDGYAGHVFSFAYQGCIAGASRQDHGDSPTYLATLKTFNSDGFALDFQSADDAYANDQLTYIAMDCPCHAGLTSMLSGTGNIDISGAPFTPVAALFGAAPSVGSAYTTPWSPINYGINGDENTSFGYAVSYNGAVRQGGVSWFDKGGFDAAGSSIVVNGHESDSTAMHDGNYLTFTDAVIKGQSRLTYQSFAESGKVAFGQFTTSGLRLNQLQSSGRSGKVAFLLIGG
jgi:hypothetical protein